MNMNYNLTMTLVGYVVFSALIASVSGACNIQKHIPPESEFGKYLGDFNDPNDNGKFFSYKHGDSCYIFSLHKAKVKDALSFCNTVGGHLTYVETETDNILQRYILKESKILDSVYWIGLMWNRDLDMYYWNNGARYPHFHIKSGCSYVGWRGCVTMGSAGLNSCGCAETLPFICKLDLGCYQENNTKENSTECSNHCLTYVHDYMKKRNDTRRDDIENSTTRNFTDDGAVNNSTHQANDKDDDDYKDCGLYTDRREILSKFSLIIVSILGGVILILLVAVTIMFSLIVKYRRTMTATVTSPRISLIDIFQADKAATSKTMPAGYIHPCETSQTERLYTDPDKTYSDVKENSPQDSDTSDPVYPNYATAESSALIPRSVSSDSQHQPLQDNSYCVLDRNRKAPADTQNIYGVASASSPVEKSPTYESFL